MRERLFPAHLGMLRVQWAEAGYNSMNEYIHAWTSAGDYQSYPRYLNVSRKDGAVVVTVRSPEDLSGEYPVPGALASCALPDEEFGKLVVKLVAFALFNGPAQDKTTAALQATLASVDERPETNGATHDQ